MGKIRVLIVDDSAFMRKMISSFLEEDHRFEIVAVARNGKDAVEKVKELKPDVVTLDVEMPILNGIDALKEIMRVEPVPVVMLSSTTKEGAENTIIAMQYGAVDFIAKPSGAISLDIDKVKDEIIQKVYHASKVKKLNLRFDSQIVKSPITNVDNCSKIEKSVTISQGFSLSKKIICIGTSTGGPRALQQVLTRIPRDVDAPIVVVQHMPPGFTKSLADRLDSISEIHVKEAQDGEVLKRGVAYIAPGGFHLKVVKVGTSLAVKLDNITVPRNGHRPAVDVLFESVNELLDVAKIAVIMTGMGSDGTEGLKKLKQSGEVRSIAESEETSVVFGMPKTAIASNKIDVVARLEKIAEEIMKMMSK
ncbi:two-component system chemotaxis response regulator CheB [Bacillus mesophilus]|uniref:Protein-glutamate methylesterase/protein-glutamine glutaminase n=1 Tax=Bacillus mesophilus TaxID=1808955 RepID=A0A6M0Q1L3_9BACI|nr:two-component system chemotaxis response regulator CheB [Bacillus mesophilus]NEY70215.1 chemotaxis response regulator protein-glutamate methylesterase [Bacillus mesophilus]